MRLLRLLKYIVLTAYSTINVAELLDYDWDGIFPRAEWHGWCSMFGNPYRVLFNPGESGVPGGWLDVAIFESIPITAKVTAVGAGVGMISLQFQGAMSLFDRVIRDEPSNMQFSADIDGVTETETHDTINVDKWNYMRFFSANNTSNVAVNVELVTHDGVRPVILPAGTPPGGL